MASFRDRERRSSDPERPLKRLPIQLWFDNPAYCISPTVSLQSSPVSSVKKSDFPVDDPQLKVRNRPGAAASQDSERFDDLTLTSSPSVSFTGSRERTSWAVSLQLGQPSSCRDSEAGSGALRESLPGTGAFLLLADERSLGWDLEPGQSLLSYCLDMASAASTPDCPRDSSDPARPLKMLPIQLWFDDPAYCISPTASSVAKTSDLSGASWGPLLQRQTVAQISSAKTNSTPHTHFLPDTFGPRIDSPRIDSPSASVGARADKAKTVTFKAEVYQIPPFKAEAPPRAACSPRSPPLTPKGVTFKADQATGAACRAPPRDSQPDALLLHVRGAASKAVTTKLPPLTLKTNLSPISVPKNLPGTPPLGSPKLSPLGTSTSRTDRAAPSTGRPDSAPSAPPRRRPDYTAPSRPNSPTGLPKNMPDRAAPCISRPDRSAPSPSAPPAGRPDCGAPSISRPDRAPAGRPDLAAPSLEAPPSRNGQRATTFRRKVARA
ncbi:hypothetical protein T484DRAFT_1761874 [Baffinella frigidus]|nr:hypothetical protein T484DRAFT_1761874 [Cryptophyta sp. CCMP2293]